MIFYKGILRSHVESQYIIPGIVTTDIQVAHLWMTRLASHASCIIELECPPMVIDTAKGVEHMTANERLKHNYWINAEHTKAVIHYPKQVRVLSDEEVATLTLKVTEPCLA